MEINVYCDESCYMENDNSKYMAIGGVYCNSSKVQEVTKRIKEIKDKYGLPSTKEVKWSKVSQVNKKMYLELVDYFFDCSFLSSRIVIVDKTQLKHQLFNQSHDDFYYKIYFLMLSAIFDKDNVYNVYTDIKDTHSYDKCMKLQNVCCNDNWDFQHKMIKKIQPIRSNESQLIQLADILIGAIVYANRYLYQCDSKERSSAKVEIIQKIKERSGYKLTKTTYLSENKLNMFFWEGNHI